MDGVYTIMYGSGGVYTRNHRGGGRAQLCQWFFITLGTETAEKITGNICHICWKWTYLLILKKAGIKIKQKQERVIPMANEYGSDFMTIVDEDGAEYELEVLTSLEYNGYTYLAVVPAGLEEDAEMEVSILKSVEEDGEPILCAIEDEAELEAVYNLIMDSLYEEEEEE